MDKIVNGLSKELGRTPTAKEVEKELTEQSNMGMLPV